MDSLAQIYERHCVKGPDVGHGDKNGTHSYIPQYERLLAPYRLRPDATLMEIGIAYGLSLAMWREYMVGHIIGVDTNIPFYPKPLTDAGVRLIKADATKLEFLTALGNTRLDVVIDDASHRTQDQIATFLLLRPLMNRGSLYIIEDILNLEAARVALQALHPSCEIIDLRKVKGRFDDVLVVYRL